MKRKIWPASALLAIFLVSAFPSASGAHVHEGMSSAAGLTKAQINKINTAINESFTQAMATATTTRSDATLTSSATVTASGRFKCATGGYIDTSYTMTNLFTKSTGVSALTGQGRQLIANWRCIAGWVINGNPYISHGLTGTALAGKANMHGTMGGGWKAVGPKKFKQTCKFVGDTKYTPDAKNGVTTIRITCVPGGVTNITERF